MSSARYRTALRTLYGAVIDSRMSSLDLRELSQELRRGRLPDELAYMIDRALEHLGGSDRGDIDDGRVAEAEKLIRRGKVSKSALASIMTSLGLPPSSSKASVREMLERFMGESSPARVEKLMDLLASQQHEDGFLAGIGGSRK